MGAPTQRVGVSSPGEPGSPLVPLIQPQHHWIVQVFVSVLDAASLYRTCGRRQTALILYFGLTEGNLPGWMRFSKIFSAVFDVHRSRCAAPVNRRQDVELGGDWVGHSMTNHQQQVHCGLESAEWTLAVAVQMYNAGPKEPNGGTGIRALDPGSERTLQVRRRQSVGASSGDGDRWEVP